MGINMELMRKKLAAAQGKKVSGAGNSPWFKPEEGSQIIRIVPANDGDPLKEFHFHYNIEGHRSGVTCPKRNFGEECPICDFATSLWREGTENNDDEVKQLAKNLFARKRYFSPVIVRGKESEGVKVYGYGKKAYEQLLGAILDPEYGDITDTESGTDIGLKYTKPKKKGAYPQTTLSMKRNTSTLAPSLAEIDSIMNTYPDFSNLIKRYSTAEVQKILDQMLSSDSSAEASSQETSRYGNQNSGGSSVDQAFNSLMDQDPPF